MPAPKKKPQPKKVAKKKPDHKCPGRDCKICLRMRTAQASTRSEPKDTSKVIHKPTKVKMAKNIDVYQVYRDVNGVAYLRVAENGKGAEFIVNKGFGVELVDMNHGTARALYLQPVVGASVLEAAKRLLRPLNDNVTISLRAKEHLETLINNKEIQMKATANVKATKPSKFATVTAPAAAKSKAKAAEAKAAKPAKSEKAAKPAKEKGTFRTGFAGHKIVVVKKDHGAREGTKRQIGMDIILGSKTTDDALPKLLKVGADPSFIKFAVANGLVKLVAIK